MAGCSPFLFAKYVYQISRYNGPLYLTLTPPWIAIPVWAGLSQGRQGFQ